MDESTLYFRFELEDGADGEALARELQDRLARLDAVAQASAHEERMRITGAEVVAAIAVGVLVVRGSRQLVHEVNLLLTEVAGMVRNIKGLTSGSVEVNGRAVTLAEVDEKGRGDTGGRLSRSPRRHALELAMPLTAGVERGQPHDERAA